MFYNPAMAPDRDLGVAFVRAYFGPSADRRSGWDATAATGVRGLRLWNEGRCFASFLLTEAHPAAAAVLERNARAYPGTRAACRDARTVPDEAPFDYVDVDPYGSPTPFLPAAIDATRPGGVLAVTATDMMVLAGVQRGAAERRYGGRPVRGRLGPEGGLRLLLALLAREARARGRRIRPLLAYVRDHHVRAYVALPTTSEAGPDPEVRLIDPASWSGPALGAPGMFGPLWLGPLFDATLVRALELPPAAASPDEVARFLARLAEDAGVDVPFYYEANRLARALGLTSPPPMTALLEGLRQAGYRAGRTHARDEGFRTDAPREIVERMAIAQSQNARVRA